ncbi:MAG: iron-sulfur cluster assembly accessory protein [Gammaproteobacteria bacterium]|nr:iron-sulfur cluster assembly accessory protein [Gammaproteobacteria bacterium]
MITLTPEAAKQVKASIEQSNAPSLPLRFACQKQEDGSLHYAMGFDDEKRDDDITYTSEGINIVVSSLSHDLLKGTTLDYVELEDGQYNFIFLNPNDPNFRPPPSVTGGEVG